MSLTLVCVQLLTGFTITCMWVGRWPPLTSLWFSPCMSHKYLDLHSWTTQLGLICYKITNSYDTFTYFHVFKKTLHPASLVVT